MKKRKIRWGLTTTLMLAVALIIALPVLAITWGEPDTEHVNVGAMVMDIPGWEKTPVCSGTLIHPRVFLTAGHCTDGANPGEVWVNFAEDQSQDNEERLDTLRVVEQVITHPDYFWGPTSNPHDVGILILAEPVTGIEPATLPTEGFLDDLRAAGMLRDHSEGAKFTMVGYGATLYMPPPDIQYEDVRQYAYSEYKILLKSWLRVSQNNATDDGGTCFGDSGGPAFWTDPDTGEEVLVGITSWGDAKCVSAGFNYRVDIPDTLDFIENVISSLEGQE